MGAVSVIKYKYNNRTGYLTSTHERCAPYQVSSVDIRTATRNPLSGTRLCGDVHSMLTFAASMNFMVGVPQDSFRIGPMQVNLVDPFPLVDVLD